MEVIEKGTTGNEAVTNLKKKCNILIDKLRTAESEKSLLIKENSSMKEYLKDMKKSGKPDSAISLINTEGAMLSELQKFVKDFVLVVEKAIEQEAIIPFVYDSKNSSEFVKIDSDEFDKSIEKYTKMEIIEFLKYCSLFRLISTGNNGGRAQYIGKVRVYMVSKKIVAYIANSLKDGEIDDKGVC